MNTFLLSLIGERIGRLITRFSELPIKSFLVSSNQNETLGKLVKELLDTYISFLQVVSIAPAEYHYSKNTIVKKLSIFGDDLKKPDNIERNLFNLITVPLNHSVVPVNIYLHESSEQLIFYTGIGIAETEENTVDFYLHKLSISTVLVKYTPMYLNYLDDMLAGYSPLEFKSLRKLAAYNSVNYNQFQKDCRIHFGDTFHQFHNKMKMLDVLEDIMITGFSLKQIASRNNFRNYNSMYNLFSKKYKFPVGSIPRLFNKISKKTSRILA